jgi:type VI secretion system ImpC/EvpB family protein
LGFIPLCQAKDSPAGVFRNTPSLQEPARFDDEQANASARLSSMLQYTLCVSRFAHYLKTMIRDRIGSWANAGELERELRIWINRYATESSDDDSVKARKPLREAKVEIQETLPGQFRMTMWLRPHFQLEDLQVALRLNSRLEAID